MKPVFKLEKEFFEKKLNVVLPDECWRKDTNIYLNMDKNTLLLSFKVEGKEMYISKDRMNETLSKYRNVSWQEEVEKNKDRLGMLERNSIEKVKEFIKKIDYKNKTCVGSSKTKKKQIEGQFNIFDYLPVDEELSLTREQLRISISGGKDSTITSIICEKAFDEMDITEYMYDYFNVSNESADTYKYVKKIREKRCLNIVNPEIGFYPWIIKEKDYFIPSVLTRNCCSTYKEGNLNKMLDKNKTYILFLGLRKHESSKRSHYDYDVNESVINAGKELNVKPNWYRFAPIVEWTDEDVWLYILKNNVEINPMYHKGFNRVGCLICCQQSPVTDLLVEEYYPKQWERWTDILKMNYSKKGVQRRLKWTLDEWLEGRWKAQVSKEYLIISKKATPKRVKELAELKGISEELAKKFFVGSCVKCGGKINPTEIAMSFKTFGRDSSKAICKDCYTETLEITNDEYSAMNRRYLDEGCQLF